LSPPPPKKKKNKERDKKKKKAASLMSQLSKSKLRKEFQKFHLNSRWKNSFAKFVASSLRICLPKEQKQERQQTQIPELLQDHA